MKVFLELFRIHNSARASYSLIVSLCIAGMTMLELVTQK